MSRSNRQIGLTLHNVQKILFEIWDPIDISSQASRDEYNDMAGPVLEFLWAGGDRNALIAMLDDFIVQGWELKPPPGRSALAADALLRLRDG